MVRNYRTRSLHEDDNSQEINLSALKSDFRRLLDLQTRMDVAIKEARDLVESGRDEENAIEKAEDYADDIEDILSKYLDTEVLRGCAYLLNGKDIRNIPVDIEYDIYDIYEDVDHDKEALKVEDLNDFIDKIEFYLSKHGGFKNGFYG